MIVAQRRRLILDILQAEGAVSISAIAARLSTSAPTIRRDLDYLDSVGQLTRTHGGAVPGAATRESSYAEKSGEAVQEKQAIGRLAASLVHDGEVVVIGPGTTTEAFADYLRVRTGLTIVTNSLPVAVKFLSSPNNEVIMTGGSLRAPIRALVGEATHSTLRGLHADTTVLSGNGLVADFGLSTPNMTVADTDRAMRAAGRSVIVLADHTKMGLKAAVQTVPTESITHVVTDGGSSAAHLDALVDRGVNVHVAQLADTLSDTI